MNRFGTSQRQRGKQIASKEQSPLKSKLSKSRFAEARLLVLVLRRVMNYKMAQILGMMKDKDKPRYSYLLGIEKMIAARKHAIFAQLVKHSKQEANREKKRIASRARISIFLFHFLAKIFHKTTKTSFLKIANHANLDLKQRAMTLCLSHIDKLFQSKAKVEAWRKLFAISFKRKTRKRILVSMVRHCESLFKSNYKLAFISIFVASASNQYQVLYGISQAQRKKFYDFENSKRQIIAGERLSLQNLKQLIDSQAYEKNIKLGQLKRQKAIKLNQLQQNVRLLERKLQESTEQQRVLESSGEKLHGMVEGKQKLAILSEGASAKVHNLFNLLKYGGEEKQQNRVSSSKIILNKEKFKTQISQFNKIKQDTCSLLVYLSIVRNNTLCAYQNVGLESIKLSAEYSRAQQENGNLKQLMNSLLSYHLLQNQGDLLLRERNSQLEQLFSNLFIFLDQESSNHTTLEFRKQPNLMRQP